MYSTYCASRDMFANSNRFQIVLELSILQPACILATFHAIVNPSGIVDTDYKLTWWGRQCSKWRPLPRTACLRLLILVTSATATPWPGRSPLSHWLRQFKLDLPPSDWSAQMLLTIAAAPHKTPGLQTVWTELVLQNGRPVRLRDL